MTPDIVFVWVAVLSFVLNGARLWKAGKRPYGVWLFGLAGLCGMLGLFSVPMRGFIAGGLWALYMLFGQLIALLETRAWMRRDWRYLRITALIRCGLYPLPPSLAARRLITQLERLEYHPDAMPDITGLEPEQAQMLHAWHLMVREDYDGLLSWSAQHSPMPHWLWMVRQRVLMEQNKAKHLLEEYHQRDQTSFTPWDLALVRLGFFAWSGDQAAVDHLLAGPLRHMHPIEQKLWRLRAETFVSQDPTAMRAALSALAQAPAPPMLQRAIAREIARCPYRPDLQDPAIITQIATWRGQFQTTPPVKKPIFSLMLVVINLVMFALTCDVHGDVRLDAAHRMGIAVYPEMAETGAWWRLLTANFLHANWVHLLMNMLGIIWIGTDLERHIGLWRYGLIYLVSGIGTMLVGIVIYGLLHHDTTPFMALGASGSIFGLLGSFAMLSWYRWRHMHSPRGKQALKGIGLVLALQSIFDFIYLEGSSTLHIAGFITGIIISMIVLPRQFRARLFTDH